MSIGQSIGPSAGPCCFFFPTANSTEFKWIHLKSSYSKKIRAFEPLPHNLFPRLRPQKGCFYKISVSLVVISLFPRLSNFSSKNRLRLSGWVHPSVQPMVCNIFPKNWEFKLIFKKLCHFATCLYQKRNLFCFALIPYLFGHQMLYLKVYKHWSILPSD